MKNCFCTLLFHIIAPVYLILQNLALYDFAADDIQRIKRIFDRIIYFSGFHRPGWDILFAHWTSIDNVKGLRQTGRMEDMATPKMTISLFGRGDVSKI